jgi:acetylornithine/N-succinyldiaminopimelate aminotransferase
VLAKTHAAVFEPGDHGSTFGGNVLTCAAAHATLKYLVENDVLGHVQQVGTYLQDKLGALQAAHACITEIRGKGLLCAVAFTTDMAAAVVTACNALGLLINPVRPNAIRLMPPLIVNEAEIDEAIEKLDVALKRLAPLSATPA